MESCLAIKKNKVLEYEGSNSRGNMKSYYTNNEDTSERTDLKFTVQVHWTNITKSDSEQRMTTVV